MEWVDAGNRPIVPDDMPPAYALLMKRCWHGHPALRPPFTEVVAVLCEIASTSRSGAGSGGGAGNGVDRICEVDPFVRLTDL